MNVHITEHKSLVGQWAHRRSLCLPLVVLKMRLDGHYAVSIVPCSPVGGALSNPNNGIGKSCHCSTHFNALLDESFSSQNVQLSFDQLHPL